jgi:transglutaminase-like putative cysteine protease
MIFKNKKIKASTAFMVLVAFGWMTAGGNAWAENRVAQRDPARAQSLTRMADAPHHIPAAYAGTGPATEMREIAAELKQVAKQQDTVQVTRLQHRLETAHKRMLQRFGETEALLRKANLPRVIWERHNAARAAYVKKMEGVIRGLEATTKSQNPKARHSILLAAAEALSESTDERPAQPFDPSHVPFRQARPVTREPFVPKSLKSGAARKTATSILNEKLIAPTASDLAANEDAQITPDIQALAASLGNQPLKIYNWVRNNIEFVPTQGSVQGSQMTLEAKRGNAYDISSLLIAMLRSAGVSAKYVTGTVEVPAATVMSWVGGAKSPKEAQQLLGVGGVPNVGVISGDTITHIRMEHVWVEAFIDYVPSRGAVHRVGDTWVPMDAAFKQHTFTPLSGLYTANPIDPVFQSTEGLYVLDESLGKFTNVNPDILDGHLAEWAERSEDYLVENGRPNNLEDLLGKQTINQEISTVFSGSLPYQVLARDAGVSTLPASLRHYVTLNGFDSQTARSLGTPSFSVKISLPELNSRRLSLQFDPATQADADTLQAARDNGASSLPVYLVNVVPVIRLDGVEKGRGGVIPMGSFYAVDVVLEDTQKPTTISYQVVAGDEIVAGVTGNGVTREVAEKRLASHPVNDASEYLHQVQLQYWMECDAMNQALAKGGGVHALRLPSVGFFSSPLSVSYLFGAPNSGVYQGRSMDVKQSLLGPTGEDPAKVVAFMKQAGTVGSYLEGSVFDQLRGDLESSGLKGISAVHLLSAAMAQEIPVYYITSANSAAVLPLLQLNPAVKSDIASAVSQGKTVIAPERNVDLGSWIGVGYIIQDETGAGAYLISGGLAGGRLLDCARELAPSWDTVKSIGKTVVVAAAVGAAVGAAVALIPLEAPAAALAGLLGLGAVAATAN